MVQIPQPPRKARQCYEPDYSSSIKEGPQAPPAGDSPYGRAHRPSVNLTRAERTGRVAIGLGAIIFGVLLLISAATALAVVLEALLVAAGLDLAVTGALGHCPLYAKLGHVPASLRRVP